MYEVVAQGTGVVLFILEIPELVSVETADPILGAKPEKALVILCNSTHGAGRQPFRYGIVPEAYRLPQALIV
jgi:hypothetical protein